jgi:DNA-binding transcriptional regulator YhcF (GntR family)
MQLRLDFHNREPIYLQIVEQVKQLVASGGLKTGDQLPTVREVAADLRINFNTAARAYRLLHEEGVISTQQGRGTYVLGSPGSAEGRRSRRERLQGMVSAWMDEADRSGFTPEEVERAWREQGDRRAAKQ